jgi:methionyl-tRNA formyltransferase
MKLVFCGTPDFAVPTLEAVLAADHEVALVLTQPDRPAGRKMELQTSAVKKLALKHGLRVVQPEKLKLNEPLKSQLQKIQPDAILVVAYGRIIPQWMLDLPRFGNINLHGSLLPKYRGAAPIQWAVANGEAETGVTTMHLDAGLDTGDVLLEHQLAINPDTMASDLFPQLSQVGADLVLATLAGLEAGTITRKPQDHSQATLAPILTREDARMDLTARTAREAYNRWRGFYPWPGAHAIFRAKRFLVHRMSVSPVNPGLPAGALDWSTGQLLAGAAEGTAIVLEEVQLEGKQLLTGIDFVRGFQLKPGEFLE